MAQIDPKRIGGEIIDLGIIDLDRHDFDGLRNDIIAILDVQRAVLTTLKWTLLIPLIGSVVAWFVFDGRMARWVLVPYMLVLVGALTLAAINVGLMFVLRNRIAETNQAADRVLAMTAAIHTDYLQVRSGEVELPMSEIAGVLTRELIFPILFAGGSSAVAAAATATGPLGWVGSRLLKYPLQAVEKRVLDVLDSPELEQAAAAASTEPTEPNEPSEPVEPGTESESDLPEGADIVAAMLTPALGDAGLDDWYGKAYEIVHRVVGGVSTVATGSLGTVLFFACLPLLGWLAFGWFVL